jgi:hypothetical protein
MVTDERRERERQRGRNNKQKGRNSEELRNKKY